MLLLALITSITLVCFLLTALLQTPVLKLEPVKLQDWVKKDAQANRIYLRRTRPKLQLIIGGKSETGPHRKPSKPFGR